MINLNMIVDVVHPLPKHMWGEVCIKSLAISLDSPLPSMYMCWNANQPMLLLWPTKMLVFPLEYVTKDYHKHVYFEIGINLAQPQLHHLQAWQHHHNAIDWGINIRQRYVPALIILEGRITSLAHYFLTLSLCFVCASMSTWRSSNTSAAFLSSSSIIIISFCKI